VSISPNWHLLRLLPPPYEPAALLQLSTFPFLDFWETELTVQIYIMRLILFLALTGSCFHLGEAVIDRERIVRTFNVRRNESSEETPLQVGNGNFAFGADITGLQTFRPYGIMSSWGWHNASLPATAGQTNISGKLQRPWVEETTP
jgi:hypothetical protein